MYDGPIFYKGDEERAKGRTDAALSLAHAVVAQKEALGVDNFERSFQFQDGGLVTVTLQAHTSSLLIEMPELPAEEEEEPEEPDELDDLHGFVIHPASTNAWELKDDVDVDYPPAFVNTSPEWLSSGQSTISPLVADAYDFVNQFKARIYWRGPDGLLLHTPTQFPDESKYQLGAYAKLKNVYWHDTRVYQAPPGKVLLGYGVYSGRFIALVAASDVVMPGSYDIGAGYWPIEVMSYPWTPPTVTQEGYTTPPVVDVSLPPDADEDDEIEPIATFDQNYESYNSSAPVMSAVSEMYKLAHGTIWFSFSPDGSKAVRCRAFAYTDVRTSGDLSGLDGWTDLELFSTYKDELDFTGDTVTRNVTPITTTAGNSRYYRKLEDWVHDEEVYDTGLVFQEEYFVWAGSLGCSTYHTSYALAYEEIRPTVDAYWATQAPAGYHFYDTLFEMISGGAVPSYKARWELDGRTDGPHASSSTGGFSSYGQFSEREVQDQSTFYLEDKMEVLDGYRPVAFDYDASGEEVEFGLVWDGYTWYYKEEVKNVDTYNYYTGTAHKTFIEDDPPDPLWFAFTSHVPAYHTRHNDYDMINRDAFGKLSGRYTKAGTSHTFLLFETSSTETRDDSYVVDNFVAGFFWPPVVTRGAGEITTHSTSDTMLPCIGRGGLTAMDLRNGVFVVSDIHVNGFNVDDNLNYQDSGQMTFDRSDRLLHLDGDVLVSVDIPQAPPTNARPSYTVSRGEGNAYADLAYGPNAASKAGMTNLSGIGDDRQSRILNLNDGSLAVADNGTICFQVASFDMVDDGLSEGMFEASSSPSTTTDAVGCGQAAFMYVPGDEEFTYLPDIMGINILADNGNATDYGFSTATPAYNLASSIAYVIIERELDEDSEQ